MATAGRPSKGPRTTITARIPDDVYAILESQRRAAGVRSVSQYIADVLSAYTGRPDLILELDTNVLRGVTKVA